MLKLRILIKDASKTPDNILHLPIGNNTYIKIDFSIK